MGEEEEEEPILVNNEENIQTNLDEQNIYTYPQIKFDIPPYKTYHFYQQFRNTSNPNNFLKAVKWSPDGSCFLTSSDDNTLRKFNLPDNEDTCPSAPGDSYVADLVVSEGESVYDYCWYPYMSASDPATCVFASTTRDHPLHLWDAVSGQLRGTYRAYDAMDEISAAFSAAFNPSGTKLFAGYNKSVRIFDIHRPGRDFEQYSTLQGNKEGQSGIISTIAFCPSNTGMLAAGSYGQTTAIYSEGNMELLYVLHGQEGGVTHVQFSRDGNYLYTGGRKDPFILCWDIRNTVSIVYKVKSALESQEHNLYETVHPEKFRKYTRIYLLYMIGLSWFKTAKACSLEGSKTLKRVRFLFELSIRLYRSSESTNQRILFDIEPSGRHLGTGGQDGQIHIYDLQTGQWVTSFQAASDTVNGFCFHPFLPIAASSSGHRRFGMPDDLDEGFSLSDEENCASVWSFFYSPIADNEGNIDCHDSNTPIESEDIRKDS
ncbi:hypothetical protein IFM89_008797 [Coptis chinensis]|uniref:Telomerase Cajal body protein 1 n=1 Tax=Coptis chinensis TaxID=261450 RepID=A0A835LDE6_9MAGN|nr:hypothetical protein IFM89_008797 [Coptis chinensis]